MTAPLRVLLIEDSPTDAKLVLRELRRTGQAVDCERVETADAMREALGRRAWDVVISDWSLPTFSAPAALAVLQELQLDLPFIIVSGTIGEEHTVAAMRAGAHDYVLKDRLARLAPAVEREIRERGVRQSRRDADAALLASEARLRRLWDSGLIVISTFDMTGGIRDINEAGARMLGYSRAELLSGALNWNELTPPEWLAVATNAMEQLGPDGVAPPWEQELFKKDGSRVSILTGTAMLDGAEGISFAVDVTREKRAQKDLLERVRIAALTAEVGMLLAQADPLSDTLRRCADAMVSHLGAALARIWTLNAKENVLELQASAGMYTHLDGPHGRIPVGTLKIGLIAEERRPLLMNNVADDPLIGDRAWAKREGLTAFAGHPLLVSGQLVGVVAMFSRQPLSDAVRKGLGSLADAIAVGIQRKVVEETGHSLEAQLRHAQKMEAVGRLAGGIAHDFNNVLSVILSYGEMIMSDLKAGDPLRDDVAEIYKAGERAADLTRQLLMFSRQQVIEPRVLDLNELLAGMDNMLRRLVGEDVELVIVGAASLGRVLVDPGSIEQVIMNLVVNARDAMPRGGKLTIETMSFVLDEEYARTHLGARPGPCVMLAVTDTGDGIEKATIARIFDPFFTTKDKGKGTGLGLSTVFGIVQQSGGSIWVYSEPGIGTTFKVYLPQVDAHAEPSQAPRVSAALRGSETILLVEDEEQVRNAARGILRRQGYTVIEARDAAEALRRVEGHDDAVHLLVSDVVMPGVSGPALAKQLVQLRPAMKVLLMSGYTDDTAVRHGVIDAALAYLQKPFTVETLSKKVREVLDSKRTNGS